MNLSNLVFSNTGLVHLIFSIMALILGTMVLFAPKGTTRHKRFGYFYTAAMIGLIVTAFMIYHLFDKFGIFHWMAVLSTFTLLAGMLPILLKKPTGYISLHFNFMYWSVFGLYGAFVAETLVRMPSLVDQDTISAATFYNVTGVAVGIVMFFGFWFMRKNQSKWQGFDKNVE